MPLVVAELTASLRQRRDEPWSRSRTALREEWRRTAAEVGPRLRETLDCRLSDIDARLAAATDRKSRDAAASVLDTIRDALLTPDCLYAAWQDLVIAAGDNRISAASALTARAQLKGLLVAAGRDAAGVERRIRAVLDDDATAVAEMRLQTGELTTAPCWRDLRQRCAGASASDRQALAAAAITQPPPVGRCVGWVAFAHASLQAMRMPAGPVTYFDAEWAMANAQSDHGAPFPERMDLLRLVDHLPDPDDVREVVLARVDLGERPAAGVIEAAQDVAMAVVEMATVGEAGVDWTPFGWTALLLNGAPHAVRTFDPDGKRDPTPWRRQQVAGQLTRSVPMLASALTSSGLPTTLRTAVRAAADGHNTRGPLAVLSRYRLLEMVAAHAGRDNPWQIGSAIAAQWPMASWRRDASFAVGVAMQAARAVTPNGSETLAGIRKGTGAGTFTDDLEVAADRCDELVAASEGWLARWLREPIAAVDDPAILNAILAGYRRDRTLLQGRFQRLRDALVHGNPVDATVAASVDDFAHFVGHGALSSALDAFRDGTDLVAELGRRRREVRDREQAVEAGTPVRQLWRSA